MKLLKRTLVAALTLALLTPSFALAKEGISDAGGYPQIVLSEKKKQELFNLIDETVKMRDIRVEEFKNKVRSNQEKKKKRAKIGKGIGAISLIGFSACIVFITPALLIDFRPAHSRTNLEAGSPVKIFVSPDFATRTNLRLIRYDEVKKLYD